MRGVNQQGNLCFFMEMEYYVKWCVGGVEEMDSCFWGMQEGDQCW